MRTLFYPRLAWDGIRKNKRMVFPYVLTCICMISMFYTIAFLASPATTQLLPRGRGTTETFMVLGCFVIAIFSLIFLFYTNSFLIRRRAAEFGLYNVLGMGKRNLAKIITHESMITSVFSLFFGLAIGIVFSKIAEIGLIKMLGGTITYTVRVDLFAIVAAVIVYTGIFGIIWISSVIRVGRSTAVSLIKSDKAGEKPPKANWFLGLLGAAILGGAYYIACTLNNPIAAILWFFVAVVMVIVATYLLLIAGSVVLCKILQKNKSYYYKANHFVSVSSMVYRMKRNGAGLASITIISTMVLVILSSTTCLWFGTRRMITGLYPGDVNFMINFQDSDQLTDENINFIKEYIDKINREENVDASAALDIRYLNMFGNADGDTIDFEMNSMDEYSSDIIRSVCVVSLDNYNEQTGSSLSLSDDEAILFASGCNFNHDTITLQFGDVSDSFKVVNPDTKKFFGTDFMKDIVPLIVLVVPDFIGVADDFSECVDSNDYSIMDMRWIYSVDIATDGIVCSEYGAAVTEKLRDTLEDNYYWMYFQDREEGESEYLSLNGSFLFLGIMLSIIFALAAVLIIYYKQISEGYEDCKRFGVMRKVGMTGKDIKRSINSQLLVVFFIPLVFAGVHLLFAFPIISKLLVLFGLYDVTPFMITTLVSFILFALFYSAVYKVTSNVYYNIVSDAQ